MAQEKGLAADAGLPGCSETKYAGYHIPEKTSVYQRIASMNQAASFKKRRPPGSLAP
jgi:hypothetical protein